MRLSMKLNCVGLGFLFEGRLNETQWQGAGLPLRGGVMKLEYMVLDSLLGDIVVDERLLSCITCDGGDGSGVVSRGKEG